MAAGCKTMSPPAHIPPPVLASARVLAYALVADDAPFTANVPVVAAGRELGRVPCLALGTDLSSGAATLLYCDREWDVLTKTRHPSIEDAKRTANANYPGLRWQETSFTDAEAAAFLDEEDRGLVCSFCGRHPHEVARIVTGHRGAAICELCIRSLRERVKNGR